VFVDLVIQHAMRIHHIILHVLLYHIFSTLSHKGHFSEAKIIEHKM